MAAVEAHPSAQPVQFNTATVPAHFCRITTLLWMEPTAALASELVHLSTHSIFYFLKTREQWRRLKTPTLARVHLRNSMLAQMQERWPWVKWPMNTRRAAPIRLVPATRS